jgi:predicted permease
MTSLAQDLRYAARTFRKNPGFAAIAVATLALGIGASCAIYTVVHSVLLKPLPFRDPGRLVRVTSDLTGQGLSDAGLSYPELSDYRGRSGLFTDISGVFPINANLTDGNRPERVEALLVDVNYFSMLGVEASLGRLFRPEDYRQGIAEVGVISDGLWRRRYGADRGVIGKTFRLDNDTYTILGVLPPVFRHPGRVMQTDVDVWCPAGWIASPFSDRPIRNAYFLQGAIARLAPGVSVEQARARLATLGAALAAEYPNDYPKTAGWVPRLSSLQEDLVGKSRPALLVLLGAVGFVLLIACANVANLLLARASGRRREIAVRRALGASRARLVAQLLTESVLLSLVGGGLGLALGVWGVELLLKIAPAALPRTGEIGVDVPVLAFAFLLSAATGLLFGMAPAIQSSGSELNETLKESARGSTGARGGNRLRGLLVVGEFALALVLLIGAGLLLKSFWRLQRVDPGFDGSNVLTASVWLPQPNKPETGPYFLHPPRALLYRRILSSLGRLPGVRSAGGVSVLPLSNQRPTIRFAIEGRAADAGGTGTAESFLASPGYFPTMRISLVRGRFFTDAEDEKSVAVAVVNEAFEKRFFPGEDPIGRRVQGSALRGQQPPWTTIVGIVADVKTRALDAAARPQLYRSLWQSSNLQLAFVVKSGAAAAGLAPAVGREVRAADSDLPVFAVRPMEEILSAAVAPRRFALDLLALFAAVALSLAAVGVYGVMAYTVSQRVHEIGIRMALGARRRDVFGLVLGQGFRLTVLGVVLGLAGALALTRGLSALLYDVGPRDPLTYAGIAALLCLVSLAACCVPARRATRLDPMAALRTE